MALSTVRVTGTTKGRTVTSVTLADVADTDTDEYLTNVAMTATHETRSSLFGAAVKRYPDDHGATVHLYTD